LKKHFLRALAILAAGLVGAVALNAARPAGGIHLVRPPTDELVRQAGIVPVSLDTVKLLLADKRFLFLDARPANAYRRGRIPGATSFPEEEFQERIRAFEDSVAFDRLLVTYCDGPECQASEMLSKELQEAGYKSIHWFHGGWYEWSQAKEAIEK
jgi:rhodanese-related sulfurtransferase